MQIRNRAIRLFVSSTFNDMHEERDALCRFVFPCLEDFCNSRNIGFTGIDLRWGVTEEEVRQGKTIGLCLSEIDNCRPWFLGILGERYGWIPEKTLTAGYEELFRGDISITEAEMRYGALGNQNKQPAKAFFCLRHPELTRRIAGDAGESPGSRTRLRELKDEIKKIAYPVLDGYASIEAFSAFIREQICRAVENEFPAGAGAGDEYATESIAHSLYAQNLDAVFTGRDRELADIDRFFAANDPSSLFLTGASGTGKTAVLARWTVRRRESHPGTFIFTHFYGASIHSSQWENLAKRLIYELFSRFRP